MEGWSVDEIARHLGMTEGQIWSSHHRTGIKLRPLLARRLDRELDLRVRPSTSRAGPCRRESSVNSRKGLVLLVSYLDRRTGREPYPLDDAVAQGQSFMPNEKLNAQSFADPRCTVHIRGSSLL